MTCNGSRVVFPPAMIFSLAFREKSISFRSLMEMLGDAHGIRSLCSIQTSAKKIVITRRQRSCITAVHGMSCALLFFVHFVISERMYWEITALLLFLVTNIKIKYDVLNLVISTWPTIYFLQVVTHLIVWKDLLAFFYILIFFITSSLSSAKMQLICTFLT